LPALGGHGEARAPRVETVERGELRGGMAGRDAGRVGPCPAVERTARDTRAGEDVEDMARVVRSAEQDIAEDLALAAALPARPVTRRTEPDRRAARPSDPAGILDALAPRMPAGQPQTCRTDDPARVTIPRPRPARILPVLPVSISASGPVRVTTTFPSTLRNALPLSSSAMSASHRSPP
jgi:hypothetical protein